MVLEIDENNYIVRVQSEPAADEPVPPDSSFVVRGPTQVQAGDLIAESSSAAVVESIFIKIVR